MRGSYLSGKIQGGLLGAGTWPGAVVHDVEQFFDPRFCVVVPEELILDIFPFLPELQQVIWHACLYCL